MGCVTCGGIPDLPQNETELSKAMRLAKIEAERDGKVYVVVNNNGVYYPECFECRNKSTQQDGTIIAYIR